MGIFDNIKDELTASFSDWIKINDNKSGFTIEDFPNVEFLSKEQERTFMLATFVYMTLDLDGDMFFRYNNIKNLIFY